MKELFAVNFLGGPLDGAAIPFDVRPREGDIQSRTSPTRQSTAVYCYNPARKAFVFCGLYVPQVQP